MASIAASRVWNLAAPGAVAAGALAVGAAVAVVPPPVAVGIVVTCCALPFMFARPVLALYAAIAFLSVDRFLVLEAGAATLKASHVLFALALAGALADRAVTGRALSMIPAAARRILVAGTALAATQLLSFLAGWPGTDTAIARVAIILGGALVPFLAIVMLVDTERSFRAAAGVFALSQVAAAMLGLYEFASLQVGLPVLTQNLGVVAEAGRVAGFALEPGYYAAGLATVLPLLIYLIVRTDVRPLPFLGAIGPRLAAGTVLLALLLANSRAGYVLTAIAIVVTLLLLARARVVEPGGLRRFVTVAIALVAAVGLVSTLLGARPVQVIAEQVRDVAISPTLCKAFRNNNACTSNTERFELYVAGREIFFDHLLFGVGEGVSGELLPQYGIETFANREATLSNVPLEVGAESGLIGLFAFGFLVWRVGGASVPRRGEEDGVLLARMLMLGGLILLTAGGLILVWLWDVRFWTLVGLSAAGLAIAARGGAPSSRSLANR